MRREVGEVSSMIAATFHGMDYKQVSRRVCAMDFVTPRMEEIRSRQALGDTAAKDMIRIYWTLWNSWDWELVEQLEHAIERYENEDD